LSTYMRDRRGSTQRWSMRRCGGAAVRRATDAECVLVELHSNRERTQARQFYERTGIHVTGNYFVCPLT
jgi:hypothetical protein